MLIINDLSVVYPDKTQAVDALTLAVDEGESVALIGANGAGKTSLIMAVVGVLPSGGEIIVDGVKLTKETVRLIRAQVGVVFQNPDDQLFMPTVYEDAAFGPRNLGVEDVEARVEKYLTMLQISHLSGKSAARLSGGEKRMAALASVLSMEPKLVLFDEPSAFLDPKARRNLIQTLNSLSHTKLVATHDLRFALATCKRAVLLKDGKVFADGISNEILFNEKLMDACGVEAILPYRKGNGV
ncbi:MAG TPA: ABC transporter ATP-binding protein [Clostridia bacterium]|nr:ABC transporter ATP-binding protein [Clostridia bacterium]